MAKKKSFFKRIFGRRFGVWDAILLLILAIWVYFKVQVDGWYGLFDIFGSWIFGIVIVSVLVGDLIRRAKK